MEIGKVSHMGNYRMNITSKFSLTTIHGCSIHDQTNITQYANYKKEKSKCHPSKVVIVYDTNCTGIIYQNISSADSNIPIYSRCQCSGLTGNCQPSMFFMYSFESLVSIISFCSLRREQPDSSKASIVCCSPNATTKSNVIQLEYGSTYFNQLIRK